MIPLTFAVQEDPVYKSLSYLQKVQLFEKGTCPGHVGEGCSA